MVKTRNLDALNKNAKHVEETCEGKCTRVNTENSNEKSVIDYAILLCT